ncbi:MAG: choice-of-anchor A family protein [Cyanobacteria bacterium P01_D01_bin.73]
MFHSKRTLQAIAAGFAIPLIFASSASAMTLKGDAQEYNLFLFEDWEQKGGDVEGRAAVGGNATLQNVGVGDRLPDSDGSENHLVVGGDLNYNGGQVFGGNAVVGGSASGVNYDCGGCSTESGEPIDFEAAEAEYRELSDYLYSLEETGSQNVVSGSNQLQLTGSGTGTHVFNVDLNNIKEIFLDASSLSDLVVINVQNSGAYASQITSMFHTEANSDSSKWENVIWNFNQATELDLRNLSWRGTILAPDAHLKLQSGNIEGQTIAKSASLNNWSGEFHNYSFNGKLPDIEHTPVVEVTPPIPVEVPEPSVLLGLGGVGLMALKRARQLQRQEAAA